MPSFDHDFAREEEDYLIGLVQENVGCFNSSCRARGAKKRCSRCGVAVYCSKSCQAADWRRSPCGHKGACKMYLDNTAVDTRPEGNGQRGPVAIGLYSIGLIDDETLSRAMCDRSASFLREAKKHIKNEFETDDGRYKGFGFRKPTISLAAGVVYDMEKARLVCAATFAVKEEGGSREKKDRFEAIVNQKTVTVNYILHEVVDDGGVEVQRRLHPSLGGSGDVSEECRAKVIEELYLFVRMVGDYGMAVKSITYGRGLMWLRDKEWEDKKRMIDEANDGDGNRIIWMPDVSYVQEDMMAKFGDAVLG